MIGLSRNAKKMVPSGFKIAADGSGKQQKCNIGSGVQPDGFDRIEGNIFSTL
ncbi:hypothetical protein SAMN05216332_101435 [Nitrosospira briensis]|nr:hypothetical protein SAMN05216332_101435 [Nitrosospira briensis]